MMMPMVVECITCRRRLTHTTVTVDLIYQYLTCESGGIQFNSSIRTYIHVCRSLLSSTGRSRVYMKRTAAMTKKETRRAAAAAAAADDDAPQYHNPPAP